MATNNRVVQRSQVLEPGHFHTIAVLMKQNASVAAKPATVWAGVIFLLMLVPPIQLILVVWNYPRYILALAS